MSDLVDPLARSGVASPGDVLMTCPVCRWQQPPAENACARCGADLGLLADVLREAKARQEAVCAAIGRGDTADALAHLEWLCMLSGPTHELATVRAVVRRGRELAELPETRWWRDPLELPTPEAEEPGR